MKNKLIKLALIVVLEIFAKTLNAQTYAGRDNTGTFYYVCMDNKEVAEILGFEPDSFNLAAYNVYVSKAEKVREEDDYGYYVVLIGPDNSFFIDMRCKEYDIFFYKDFEDGVFKKYE